MNACHMSRRITLAGLLYAIFWATSKLKGLMSRMYAWYMSRLQ